MNIDCMVMTVQQRTGREAMKTIYTLSIIFVLFILLFVYPFSITGAGVDFKASMIGIFNFIAFISAVASYVQFIFPQRYEDYEAVEYNRIPFQFFNILFVLLFFTISINFLIANKQFYQGYETLDNEACIKKYYLSNGFNSIMQIVIASSVVVNIIYILTHLTDYYGGQGTRKSSRFSH